MLEVVLPKITVLTTGGTIAGLPAKGLSYQAGLLPAEHLLDAIPQIRTIAKLSIEAHADVGSQDVSLQIWQTLALRVRELLRDDTVHAVVITHGTDTLEETAYWLHLATQGNKPVVLTGAMRPPHAPGADGPSNLLAAVTVAASPAARQWGVCVVMDDVIYDAVEVQKERTAGLGAFNSRNHGPLGRLYGNTVQANSGREQGNSALRGRFADSVFSAWPKVHILPMYAGIEPDFVDAMLATHPQGIVVAGVGNGNASKAVWQRLQEAASHGVAVVRASRVAAGSVVSNVEVHDDHYGFLAAGGLSPQKARILLLAGLTQNRSRQLLHQLFLGI